MAAASGSGKAAATSVAPAASEDSIAMIKATFRRFDINGDGFITKEELAAIFQKLESDKWSERRLTELLDGADANGDGRVDYDEFLTWCLTGGGSRPGSRPGTSSSRPATGSKAALKRTSVSGKARRSASDLACAMEEAEEKHGEIDINPRVFMPERFEMDIQKRFNIGIREIGEGGYGKVFVAKDKEMANRTVAIKKVTRTRPPGGRHASGDAGGDLENEIRVMKELDHPNICKLLGVYSKSRDMYFIMELCEGGELFDRITTGNQKFLTEDFSRDIIRQVGSALHYAHARGIAHRDIKPENVVFCSADPMDTHVKLIDWGLAMCFLGGDMKCAVGSATYCAPEVFQSRDVKKYNQSCDLWSLGVLTYVMLCGKPPFWGSHQQHMRNALHEKYRLDFAPWNKVSPQGKDFVKSLIKAKPAERGNMAKVEDHAWLQMAEEEAGETISKEVLDNLRLFSNASSFSQMCITAVARQLDHKHLKGIHKVFRDMDTDGNGVLSFEEVKEGFRNIFGEQSEHFKEAKSIFDELDLDGSGSLDYTEFCAAGMGQRMADQDDVIWGAFKAFDIDNSGAIEVKDLQKILDLADVKDAWSSAVCAEVSKTLMAKHDTDGDGMINFEDWKRLMKGAWESDIDTEEAELNDDVYDLLTMVNSLPFREKPESAELATEAKAAPAEKKADA